MINNNVTAVLTTTIPNIATSCNNYLHISVLKCVDSLGLNQDNKARRVEFSMTNRQIRRSFHDKQTDTQRFP